MKASFDLDKRDLGAFRAACTLEGKDTNVVVAVLIREYTGKALAKAADECSEPTFDEARYHAKAIKRIPKWAGRPEQYNHKIHSKVFIDDGYVVTIWDEVKPKLDEYVGYFVVDLDEKTVSGKEQ